MEDLQTTRWDDSHIYKNLTDLAIVEDCNKILTATEQFERNSDTFKKIIQEIEEKNFARLTENLELIKKLYRYHIDTTILCSKVARYAQSKISVNSQDNEGKELFNNVLKLHNDMNKAFAPIQLCVLRSPEHFFTAFLNDERTRELNFSLSRARSQNDFLLSVNEEIMLKGFSIDGFEAWDKLYNDISGAMKVDIDGEAIGLSSANNLYMHPDRSKREKAFRGINAAWRKQEISACAILNSINGWRNEDYKNRSTIKKLHYLDKATFNASITRETLDTLMSVTSERKNLGQAILKKQAQDSGLDKLGPWDLMAPAPFEEESSRISFPDAIDMIKTAFNEVHPDMAEFVELMMKKNWIDSAPSDNRKQGAYCSGYAHNREPRVFMTYEGSIKNVIVLAHELGHAYHNWVMRDLPFYEVMYPMTLAETASIFAETIVRNYFIQNSQSKKELKSILWQDIQSAQSLLINIPSRFEFEKRFVELRLKKTLSVPETKELMIESQKVWYGDTLTEYDEMFWASKLHFHMAGRSFYNYPYLFGYLFSLGIYAKKDSLGKSFHDVYIRLLRDTGRMTAEELVAKHFNEDIRKPEFWTRSFDIVAETFERYKNC